MAMEIKRPATAFATKSKYGNEKTMHRGVRYDSKFESQVRMVLDQLQNDGIVTDIKDQVAVSLEAEGEHICEYKVDFRVELKSGRVIWVEAKGFATGEWRLKKKLMEKIYLKNHPGEEYVVVTKSNLGGRNRFDKNW